MPTEDPSSRGDGKMVGVTAPQETRPGPTLAFGIREARHLLNRAGFGATSGEVAAWAELGLEGALDKLFAMRPASSEEEAPERVFLTGETVRNEMMRERGSADISETDGRQRWLSVTGQDRGQMVAYAHEWQDRLCSGESPLVDRLTLFWHGHFACSMARVQNSYDIIHLHRFLREHALDRFRVILEGVSKSPAMLAYLGNQANRKDHPNENFARELLELFTLGIGHYTERDVTEAARALTGWTVARGEYCFQADRHDEGSKTFLGRTGPLKGEDVLGIILEQRQCARWIAGKLLAFFEGVAPAPERLETFATRLHELDYAVGPFLGEVFSDPGFYDDATVGACIADPVAFAVGSARRLGIAPPGRLLDTAARVLGQHLFHPPNVKGWDGGRAWIGSSTMIQRANLAAVYTGQASAEQFVAASRSAVYVMAQEGESRPDLPAVVGLGWEPELDLEARYGSLRGADLARALGHDLLAVPLSAESAADLEAFVADVEASASESGLGEAELRRIAHRTLVLPEAHLI